MIDPTGMTLLDWTASTTLSVKTAWSIGRLDDEMYWRDWATGLLRATPFNAQCVPDPYQFDSWYEWAMRVAPLLEVT